MRSDAQLQSDVEAEFEWDPSIDARGIKVAVKNGLADPRCASQPNRLVT